MNYYDQWTRDVPVTSINRCYHSHHPLPLKDGLVIYGGSCMSPVLQDADIYVGLDRTMAHSPRAYPWEPGESFLFPIQDMHAPENPAQFKNLIDWLAVQLIAQKKVHVGCVGGHGRTGTVFAALVKVMLGEPDAIAYVRQHYCKKAVETAAQIDFLVKHFGITPAEPTKRHNPLSSKRWDQEKPEKPEKPEKAVESVHHRKSQLPSGVVSVAPTKSPLSVWNPQITIDNF